MRSSQIVLKILQKCIYALFFVLVLFAVVRLTTGMYQFGYRLVAEEPVEEAPGRDVIVEIKEGSSCMAIGKKLKSDGLVNSAYLFAIQMKLSGYGNQVLPGTYTLNTSQTAREMLAVMSTEAEAEE